MNVSSLLEYLKKNYIVGICGLVIVICLGVFIVRNDQITRMAADYDDLTVRRTRILKNLKHASEIEADLSEMRAMDADVKSRMFSPEDLATNQRYFYELESATGVEMASIQQIIKPIPPGKAGKKARKKAQKAHFQEIIYDLSIRGTYEEILSFMREVEDGRAFSSLVGFSVIPVKTLGSENEVIMKLSVSVLGRKTS